VYSAVWEELLPKRPAWCGDKYYELYYTVVMVSEHNETIVERYKDIENILYSNNFSNDDLENKV